VHLAEACNLLLTTSFKCTTVRSGCSGKGPALLVPSGHMARKTTQLRNTEGCWLPGDVGRMMMGRLQEAHYDRLKRNR